MNPVDELSHQHAERFGAMVRSRRHEMGLRLEDLASASGVGIRFVHDLETGKPSCQLGKALVVAAAVGLRPLDLLQLDLLEEQRSDDIDLPISGELD